MVQRPHAYLARIRALDLEFTHFKDHLFLQRIAPQHPRLDDDDAAAAAAEDGLATKRVPVGCELWQPLTLTLRGRMPALVSLRVTLSPPGALAEGLVDVLREWEREGHGWVTEKADGVVYMELGRRRRTTSVAGALEEAGSMD